MVVCPGADKKIRELESRDNAVLGYERTPHIHVTRQYMNNREFFSDNQGGE
jgi:hypothetical protein